MNRKIKTLTRVALCGALLCAMSVSPLYPNGTVTINCDAPGANLQDKFTFAVSEIWIQGHCANGPFSVGSDVRLFAKEEGATLSAVPGSDSVFNVGHHTMAIVGITIDATGADRGITVSKGILSLRHSVVKNAGTGVLLDGGDMISINSQFRNNGTGALISGGSASFYSNNTFEQNGLAIQVVLSGSASISGGTIDDNDTGIDVKQNSSVIIGGVTITNNNAIAVLVRQHGFFRLSGVSTFGGNGGADVRCTDRAIVEASTPQTGDPGIATDDGTCLVFGPIF